MRTVGLPLAMRTVVLHQVMRTVGLPLAMRTVVLHQVMRTRDLLQAMRTVALHQVMRTRDLPQGMRIVDQVLAPRLEVLVPRQGQGQAQERGVVRFPLANQSW